jgi:hypothetical protein
MAGPEVALEINRGTSKIFTSKRPSTGPAPVSSFQLVRLIAELPLRGGYLRTHRLSGELLRVVS